MTLTDMHPHWNHHQDIESEYSETDGQPMAEADKQRKPLTYMVVALDHHFQHDPHVYVPGNLFIYYVEGDSTKSVAPDVLLCLGYQKVIGTHTNCGKKGLPPDWSSRSRPNRPIPKTRR